MRNIFKLSDENKKKYRPYLVTGFVIYMVFVIIIFLTGFTILFSDVIKTGGFLFSQVQNFKENKQTLPNFYENEVNENFTRQDLTEFYNKTIQEYKLYIDDNYFYDDVNGYDCKYWTTIHFLYYGFNKDRYNWDFKIVDTDNHVFGLVYNDTGYCLLDGRNIDCYMNNQEVLKWNSN